MDVLEFLGDASRVLLRTFVVMAPLLAWQWVALWSRPYRGRGAGLADPTIIAGMMIGVAVLAVIMQPETLTWDAIVAVGGFWDLTLMQFIALARGMVLHGPHALLVTLVYDDARRNLHAWVALAVTIWLVRVIAVWLRRPPLGPSRLVLGEIATLVASVVGTIYLGPLLFWSINELNFWLLLVGILLIQDYRYDEPPLSERLLGAVNTFRHRRHNAPPEIMPVPDPD
jgi:hypothetical protein